MGDRYPVDATTKDADDGQVGGHNAGEDRQGLPEADAEVVGHRAATTNTRGTDMQGDLTSEARRPQGNDAEVMGHAGDGDAGSGDFAPDLEGEVEGHIHPYMSEKITESRRNDAMAHAERERRASEAQSSSSSGSLLDKLRRKDQA